jgi:two-component system OmpR family sensor kinase
VRALSLRARLTLWYTLALLAALALFGVNLLWGQARLTVRRVDRDLDNLTVTVANVIRDELDEHATLMAGVEEARRNIALAGRAMAVLDEHGLPLAAAWDRLTLPGPLPSATVGRLVWTVDTPGSEWRVHAQPQTFGNTTVVLLVASSLADARREQHEVLEAMQVAIPIVLLLAGGGGFWLASVGLRPITEMARQAALVPLTGTVDLGHADRSDELGQLARAFNALVARLRAALETERQFTADASHELRTPVSVIRAAAEVALSQDRREESEYRESLGIVRDQARRLSRLVEHMLVLTRADAGGYLLRPVDLYLNEIAHECGRALRALSAERRVTIDTGRGPDIPFSGDEDLLRQMILNVLQNAVQHTPAGGTASIAIQQDAEGFAIRVTDTGHGIAAGDQARIFDRFVQLDPSRRSEGTGLGLPIARWIAEAHRGTLVVERSDPSGSTFRIWLPRRNGA